MRERHDTGIEYTANTVKNLEISLFVDLIIASQKPRNIITRLFSHTIKWLFNSEVIPRVKSLGPPGFEPRTPA